MKMTILVKILELVLELVCMATALAWARQTLPRKTFWVLYLIAGLIAIMIGMLW